MSFLTTSRAPAFADQKEGSRSLYLALPQQSLYSFPDPQGHLSLGFGMEHLQLFAYLNITHSEFLSEENFMAQSLSEENFMAQSKKGPEPLDRGSRRTRGYARKASSEIGDESSVVHAQHDNQD